MAEEEPASAGSPVKKHKFNAKRKELDGVTYDSEKEAAYAAALKDRLSVRDIASWEHQPVFTLKMYGTVICTYAMDFKVDTGRDIELVEVKGMALPEWKLRWRMMEAAIDQKEFRQEHGLPLDRSVRLVLIASPKLVAWAGGVRCRTRGEKPGDELKQLRTEVRARTRLRNQRRLARSSAT